MNTGQTQLPLEWHEGVMNQCSKRGQVQIGAIAAGFRYWLNRQRRLNFQEIDTPFSERATVTGTDASNGCSGILLGLNAHQWIQVDPGVFGSLGCNELVVRCDPGFQAYLDKKRLLPDDREPAPLDPGLFHARFSPLPEPLNSTCDSAAMCILLVMPARSQQDEAKEDFKKIIHLLSKLEMSWKGVSLLFVIDTPQSPRLEAKQLKQIHSSLPDLASCVFTVAAEDDGFSRFRLFGFASLVLTGSPSIAHDAVLAGTPFLTWNDEQLDWADSSTACMKQSDSVFSTNSSIAEYLRERWLDERSALLHIDNKQQALTNLLDDWLEFHGPDTGANLSLHVPDTALAPACALASQDGIVMPMQSVDAAADDTLRRLKYSMDTTRRKLVKFRQSPRRFVEDSQHRWLNPLKRTQS